MKNLWRFGALSPTPKIESHKNCINTDRQKQKKVEPWRIRTSHLGIEEVRYGKEAGYKVPLALLSGYFEGGHCGGRACASGVGNAGVAGLGALRGPMVFPTL